jgi:hypothetical protein
MRRGSKLRSILVNLGFNNAIEFLGAEWQRCWYEDSPGGARATCGDYELTS